MATDVARDVAAAQVPEGAVALWWIGQGSFIFKGSDGTIFAVDPYLSDAGAKRANAMPRQFPPPILPEELAALATAIVATHEHLDHVDPEATPEMAAANPNLRFIGSRGCREAFARFGVPAGQIGPFDVGETIALGGL